MAHFCMNCGAPLKESDRFCMKCGAKVAAAPAPKQVTPEQVTPEPVSPEPVSPEPVTPEQITPEPTSPKPVSPKPASPKPVSPEPIAKPAAGGPEVVPTTKPAPGPFRRADAADVPDYTDRSTFSTASGKNLHYVVLQVTLKEKFFGTGSGNLTELEKCINDQAAKGYRLHTISTSNGGSKGVIGGDRIQATLVFEKIV